MWKPETVIMFVNARSLAADSERQGLSGKRDDRSLLRTSEVNGERCAFSKLCACLEKGDNPYRMLGKIQAVKEGPSASIAGDYVASFQYAQCCDEVASLIRAYLDHVEWNLPRAAAFCEL